MQYHKLRDVSLYGPVGNLYGKLIICPSYANFLQKKKSLKTACQYKISIVDINLSN